MTSPLCATYEMGPPKYHTVPFSTSHLAPGLTLTWSAYCFFLSLPHKAYLLTTFYGSLFPNLLSFSPVYYGMVSLHQFIPCRNLSKTVSIVLLPAQKPSMAP